MRNCRKPSADFRPSKQTAPCIPHKRSGGRFPSPSRPRSPHPRQNSAGSQSRLKRAFPPRTASFFPGTGACIPAFPAFPAYVLCPFPRSPAAWSPFPPVIAPGFFSRRKAHGPNRRYIGACFLPECAKGECRPQAGRYGVRLRRNSDSAAGCLPRRSVHVKAPCAPQKCAESCASRGQILCQDISSQGLLDAIHKKIVRIHTIRTIFVACLEGFEPPTFWFVAKHSIRLSYRHI